MLRMFNATVASNRFKSTLIITLALLLMLNFTRLIARVSSPYKVLGKHPNASWSSSSSSSSSLVAHISDRAPPRQLGSKRSKVFNTFSCFYGGWHLLFFIVLPSFPLLALSPSLSFSFLSRRSVWRVRARWWKKEGETTHSQPSLMYDSAVRVKKIP